MHDIRMAILENNIFQIKDVLIKMDKRFDNIDAEFKRIDEKFEKRFESVDLKFEKTNERQWSNFLCLLGMIVSSSVGLAYFIGHGFRWF